MPSLFVILGIKKIHKHDKGAFKFLQKKMVRLARLGELAGEHPWTRKHKRGEG